MLRVEAWDIRGNTGGHADLGSYESIQVTFEDVRDTEGNVILHYDTPSQTWFDNTGNGWYDWTVVVGDA